MHRDKKIGGEDLGEIGRSLIDHKKNRMAALQCMLRGWLVTLHVAGPIGRKKI